ncbi:hypothetical protein ACT7DJ_07350, partial [Bacillus cereus]
KNRCTSFSYQVRVFNLREQTKLRVFRIYRETLSRFFVRRFTGTNQVTCFRIYRETTLSRFRALPRKNYVLYEEKSSGIKKENEFLKRRKQPSLRASQN